VAGAPDLRFLNPQPSARCQLTPRNHGAGGSRGCLFTPQLSWRHTRSAS